MFLLSWADNHETKGSVPPESDTRIYIEVGLGSLLKMALPFLGPQSRKYAFQQNPRWAGAYLAYLCIQPIHIFRINFAIN